MVVSSRRQSSVDEAVKTLTEEDIEASGVASNQRVKSDRLNIIEHVSMSFIFHLSATVTVKVMSQLRSHVLHELTILKLLNNFEEIRCTPALIESSQ